MLGAAFLASHIAWSQPVGSYCSPFSPAREAVEALANSSPDIPDSAVLESACYRMQQRLTGISTLSDVRVETYRFSWPTDQHEAGVRFHERARCRRAGTGPLDCEDLGIFASWRDVLVRFDSRMSRFEVAEVLREANRLIPGAIYEVERVSNSQRGGRFHRLTEYLVVAVLEKDVDGKVADRYRFTVRRRCDESARCNWTVGVGTRIRIYYSVLPFSAYF